MEEVQLNRISVENVLSNDKRKDVCALLQKHYGDDWEKNTDLDFYIHALSSVSTTYKLDEDDCQCEFIPEDFDFTV